MVKYCIKCQMGDPLPHDERLGQAIYNHLRSKTNEGTYADDEIITKYKAGVADLLFNIPDMLLWRFIHEKFWCEKCKKERW